MTIPRIDDTHTRNVVIKATIKMAELQGWAISEASLQWLSIEPRKRGKLNPRVEMWTRWVLEMRSIFLEKDL